MDGPWSDKTTHECSVATQIRKPLGSGFRRNDEEVPPPPRQWYSTQQLSSIRKPAAIPAAARRQPGSSERANVSDQPGQAAPQTVPSTEAVPSTEELLQFIREEARFLQLDTEKESGAQADADPASPLPVWGSLDTEFPVRPEYHINEFLVHDDLDFLVNAYRGILQREPDEEGLDSYMALLREGGRGGDAKPAPAPNGTSFWRCSTPTRGRAAGVRIRGIRLDSLGFRTRHKWLLTWPLGRLLSLFGRALFPDENQGYTRYLHRRQRQLELSVDRYLGRQQQYYEALQQREQSLQERQAGIRQQPGGPPAGTALGAAPSGCSTSSK